MGSEGGRRGGRGGARTGHHRFRRRHRDRPRTPSERVSHGPEKYASTDPETNTSHRSRDKVVVQSSAWARQFPRGACFQQAGRRG